MRYGICVCVPVVVLVVVVVVVLMLVMRVVVLMVVLGIVVLVMVLTESCIGVMGVVEVLSIRVLEVDFAGVDHIMVLGGVFVVELQREWNCWWGCDEGGSVVCEREGTFFSVALV